MSTIIRTPDGEFDSTIELECILEAGYDESNHEQVRLFLSSWLCLLADSPLVRAAHQQKPRKAFNRFKRFITSNSVIDVIASYSALANRLMKAGKMTGEFTATGDWIPEMMDTPIFKEYHQWFQNGDPEIFSYMLSFLSFGKKLDFTDKKLTQVAFHNWQQVEERLSTLVLPLEVTNGLRLIVRSMIPQIPFEFLNPKFGPGAVAEKKVRGRNLKSNKLLFDPLLEYAFKRRHFSFDTAWAGLCFEDTILGHKKASSTESRYSVLGFADKNTSTKRSICMQPNTVMYYEQAYLDHLKRLMRLGWSSNFVDLSYQGRNRWLSQYGSLTTLLDTIDLKDASDTVHDDLVEKIFPREVLFYQKALRVKNVRLPNGQIRAVYKYAPMGSALCFPVQCITFLAISVYSAMQQVAEVPVGQPLNLDSEHLVNPELFVKRFMDDPGYTKPGSGRLQPMAIYGDDIVCDTKITPYLIHNLSALGFVVNIAKSFTGGDAFRESCGGYYYCGEDVTPLLFRVKRNKENDTSSGVASIIAAINAAGDHRYFNYKRCLTHHLLYSGMAGGEIPAQIHFTSNRDEGSGIYHPAPLNLHIKRKRYNADLQRDEVRCLVVTAGYGAFPSRRQSHAVEKYLYNQWWISHGPQDQASSHEDVHDTERRDPGSTRLSRRWIPA